MPVGKRTSVLIPACRCPPLLGKSCTWTGFACTEQLIEQSSKPDTTRALLLALKRLSLQNLASSTRPPTRSALLIGVVWLNQACWMDLNTLKIESLLSDGLVGSNPPARYDGNSGLMAKSALKSDELVHLRRVVAAIIRAFTVSG